MRLLFYFVIGNVFVINLVLVLQLAHVSNRLTLALFTAGTAGALGVKNNGLKPFAFIKNQWKNVELILAGRLGIRTWLLRVRISISRRAVRGIRAAVRFLRGRVLDLLLVAGATGFYFWRFGQNLLNTYAYVFSDMIVHNYWINSLGEGEVFVAGVYPFGFHCMMYYLHEMFGIDNYVLLRVFWLVQTLMIFYGVVVFLKGCCKNRYLPYLGMLLYIFGTYGILSGLTYERFFGSLPQEFGMIFILPSIQFLFAFFQIKKEELDDEESDGKRSLWCLAGFAMSFSLTLAVHFYNTMIVGLLCIGGIVGYGFRLFRKKYFTRVLIAGIIGIVVAVLPMAAAVAMGKPMEGSLRWGLSILKGSSNETETEIETGTEEIDPSVAQNTQEDVGQEVPAQAQAGAGGEAAQTVVNPGGASGGFLSSAALRVKGVWRAAKAFVSHINEYVRQQVKYFVLDGAYQPYEKYLIIVFYVLPCIGLVFFLFRGSRDYGAQMLSVGSGLWMLGILMASGLLGLPTLMDASRASIYTTMVLIVGSVLAADGLLYAVTFFIRVNVVRHAFALPVLVMVAWTGFHIGLSYEAPQKNVFGSNEAVLCLTNIIRQYQDETWTICSANDELRMAGDHGYHYELTDFLGEMENLDKAEPVRIPTPYVFFFIEKRPIDYSSNKYEGSGQKISEAGAARSLPRGGGLGPYQNENRWIMMSRMYYWAQEFQRKYPNEMKVYFENDNFVCYYVEQNTYALYDFAIDYGYNGR